MLNAGLTLVACQYLGDLIVDSAALRIPGVVVGLLLLLLLLGLRGWWLGAGRAVPDALNRVAKGLHDHFALLFVPAGVSVVANVDRLAADGLALAACVVLSTAATIAVTAFIGARRSGAIPGPRAVVAAE
jgi:holin-like protein